jgi:hypothetical protein
VAVPIVSSLISLVSKGIGVAIDWKREDVRERLESAQIKLDEKQLDVMREIMEMRLQAYLRENALQIDRDFRNFVVEYEGKAADVPPAVQVLRAVIRPLITLWAVLLLSYLMFSDPQTLADLGTNLERIPEQIWDIFWIVFAFWFGGRAVQHIIDKYAKGRVDEKREEGQAQVAVAEQQTRQAEIEASTVAAPSEQGAQAALPEDSFTPTELRRAFGPRRRRR